MSYADTIVEMLQRWHEAIEPNLRSGEASGDGGTPMLPATWNASYRRLAEILEGLRDGAHKRQWRHLVARHRDAEIVMMLVSTAKRGAKGREPILPKHCDLVAGGARSDGGKVWVRVRDARRCVHEFSEGRYRRTHPDPLEVARALELVEARWRARGWPAPVLPDEFLGIERERVAA